VFTVLLVDDVGAVRLSSYDLATLRARSQREAQMLSLGVTPERYRIKMQSDGQCSVLLCDATGDRVIAYGGRRFASKPEAANEIRELAGWLDAIRRDATLTRRHLRRLPDLSPVQAGDPAHARTGARQRKVAAYQRALARIVAEPAGVSLLRRNRFLDHLLARFGERFENDALAFFDPRPYGERDGFYRDLAGWKRDFLRDAVRLGGQRAQGCDYSAATAGPGNENLSGLERRLCLLLGMDQRRRPLAASNSESSHIETGQDDDAGSLLQQHGERAFLFVSSEPAVLQALLRHDIRREHFQVELHAASGRWLVHFRGPTGSVHQVHRADAEADAWAAIERLFRALNGHAKRSESVYSGEGVYVLEHLLLRPSAAGHWAAPLLRLAPIAANYRVESDAAPDASGRTIVLLLCLDDATYAPVAHHRRRFDSVGEAEHVRGQLLLEFAHPNVEAARLAHHLQPLVPIADTFYSHRISVLFAAWPVRAQHRGFRELSQQLVYDNCPAHIAAQCYWLGYRDMHDFETLYAAWVEARGAAAEKSSSAHSRHISLDRIAAGLQRFIDECGVDAAGGSHDPARQRSPALQTLMRDIERQRRDTAARK